MKYLFIIYDATQYSFQMTCNQKLHPWVHIALGLSRVTRRNVQSSLICRIFKCCQPNWCLRCPSISDRQNRSPGCALGCPIAKLFSCHYVAPGHNVAPSHHVAPRPKQHLCTIHFQSTQIAQTRKCSSFNAYLWVYDVHCTWKCTSKLHVKTNEKPQSGKVNVLKVYQCC